MPNWEKSPERIKSEKAIADATLQYNALQEQQMKNISQGDNWSPWLALQKGVVNQFKLMPNERGLAPQSGWTTAGSEKRDTEFERQKAIAEALAASRGF